MQHQSLGVPKSVEAGNVQLTLQHIFNDLLDCPLEIPIDFF